MYIKEMVLPPTSYSLTSWTQAAQTTLQSIQRLYKQALKTLHKRSRAPSRGDYETPLRKRVCGQSGFSYSEKHTDSIIHGRSYCDITHCSLKTQCEHLSAQLQKTDVRRNSRCGPMLMTLIDSSLSVSCYRQLSILKHGWTKIYKTDFFFNMTQNE